MMHEMTPNAPHLSDDTLNARLDAQLDLATSRQVDEHLAVCDACAARFAGLRATRTALSALRDVTPPRDFRLKTVAVVHPDALRPGHISAFPARRPALIARAISAVAFIVGCLLFAIGLVSATAHTVNTTAAMSVSAGAPSIAPTCSVSIPCTGAVRSPAAGNAPTTGSNASTTPTTVPGTSGEQPGVAATPTPTPSVSVSTHQDVPTPSSTSIELALGAIFAVGGGFGFWVTRGRR